MCGRVSKNSPRLSSVKPCAPWPMLITKSVDAGAHAQTTKYDEICSAGRVQTRRCAYACDSQNSRARRYKYERGVCLIVVPR
eukprot:2161435-Pleurochrysis_carterae.AAC.1